MWGSGFGVLGLGVLGSGFGLRVASFGFKRLGFRGKGLRRGLMTVAGTAVLHSTSSGFHASGLGSRFKLRVQLLPNNLLFQQIRQIMNLILVIRMMCHLLYR